MKERTRKLLLWLWPRVQRAYAWCDLQADLLDLRLLRQQAAGAHGTIVKPGVKQAEIGGAHIWVLAAVTLGSILCLPQAGRAQGGGSTSVLPLSGTGAPAGGCGSSQLYINTSNGNLYDCSSGSWNLVTGGGSGSGTVTSFSAGNLSPLFTASVATPTSTPALSFSLSNAANDTVFGNCTSSTGAPAFCALTAAMIPNPGGDVSNTFGATQVTGLHFGSTGLSLGTAPSSGQCLEYNGSNITGASCGGGGGSPCTTTSNSVQYDNAGAFGCVTQFTYTGSTLTGASGTLDLSGMTLVKLRVSGSLTASVNGDIGYDSTNNYWRMWANGADDYGVPSTNLGTSGQPCLSNANGTCTFSDPVVSYSMPAETTAAWTSSTGVNTTLAVNTYNSSTNGSYSSVVVTLNQGSTITGGAVTFQVSDTTAFTNAYSATCWQATTGSTVSAYTLTASTNQAFVCNVASYQAFRVLLSTAISGSATVNVGVQPSAAPAQPYVTALQASGANLHADIDNTPNVNIQSDASVNLAQENGTAITANPSAYGTAPSGNVIGVNADVTNTVSVSGTVTANAGTGTFNPCAGSTGSAVPSSACYHGGNGSGSLTGFLNCDHVAQGSDSTSGETQLVALSSGHTIWICGFQFSTSQSTQVSANLASATAASCGGTVTALTPAYPLQAVSSSGPIGLVVMTPGYTGLNSGSGNALCLNLSAADSVQYMVWYTQF